MELQKIIAEEDRFLTGEDIRELIKGCAYLLTSDFDKALSKALSQYAVLQKNDMKQDLAHVYICYLRSSVSERLPLYRIDLYDKRDVEDLDDCHADWQPRFAQVLYTNIQERRNNIGEINTAAQPCVEQSRRDEAEKMFRILKEYIPYIIKINRAQLSPDVVWHYGEFYDVCDEIERV